MSSIAERGAVPLTEREAFIRAVCEQPDEDTVRLVFADWLDEQGNRDDRDRAEFIRVQIAIAKRSHMDCIRKDSRGRVAVRNPTSWHCYRPHCRCEPCRLRRREYETSKRHCQWGWCKGIPAGSHAKCGRGFVESVTCTLADWIQHGSAIVAAHPVTAVTLKDREPTVSGSYAWWRFVSPGDADADLSWPSILPACFIMPMAHATPDTRWTGAVPGQYTNAVRYDTRDAALAALSDACLAVARKPLT